VQQFLKAFKNSIQTHTPLPSAFSWAQRDIDIQYSVPVQTVMQSKPLIVITNGTTYSIIDGMHRFLGLYKSNIDSDMLTANMYLGTLKVN